MQNAGPLKSSFRSVDNAAGQPSKQVQFDDTVVVHGGHHMSLEEFCGDQEDNTSRHRRYYDRMCEDYEGGLWQDQTGWGFLNTSEPNVLRLTNHQPRLTPPTDAMIQLDRRARRAARDPDIDVAEDMNISRGKIICKCLIASFDDEPSLAEHFAEMHPGENYMDMNIVPEEDEVFYAHTTGANNLDDPFDDYTYTDGPYQGQVLKPRTIDPLTIQREGYYRQPRVDTDDEGSSSPQERSSSPQEQADMMDLDTPPSVDQADAMDLDFPSPSGQDDDDNYR